MKDMTFSNMYDMFSDDTDDINMDILYSNYIKDIKTPESNSERLARIKAESRERKINQILNGEL